MVIVVLILAFKMFYYKHLWEKTEEKRKHLKASLMDAEILLKKYQIQLQRSLGNLELLDDEVTKLKNELKTVKNRNSQMRIENEQLRRKIRELENKIEALL
jgi:peptidoglycan hydrolase CwlO-like protein